LSDDLGQIQYVFSDKTGTLTQVSEETRNLFSFSHRYSQNAMVFKACSVAGRLYKGNLEPSTNTVRKDLLELEEPASVKPSTPTDTPSFPSKSFETTTDVANVLAHFHDSALVADIQHSVDSDADQAFSRSLNGFWSVLALCHTVLAAVDPVTHTIEYKAQSPDEAALVQAAADVGFVFLGKNREIMRLKTPFSDGVEEYELLNVLDFTSARKRMSVVVRKSIDEDGQRRVFLLSKGADNVIFERLRKDESENVKATTQRHLNEFANDGMFPAPMIYLFWSSMY
jgi:phospholipid-translocating ATPase